MAADNYSCKDCQADKGVRVAFTIQVFCVAEHPASLMVLIDDENDIITSFRGSEGDRKCYRCLCMDVVGLRQTGGAHHIYGGLLPQMASNGEVGREQSGDMARDGTLTRSLLTVKKADNKVETLPACGRWWVGPANPRMPTRHGRGTCIPASSQLDSSKNLVRTT